MLSGKTKGNNQKEFFLKGKLREKEINNNSKTVCIQGHYPQSCLASLQMLI